LLYLPSGYWHMARAHSHALSVSIGIIPSDASPARAAANAR
jgi:hypothetical protein